MSEAEYNEQVEETTQSLEEALDEVDEDIDYELGGGVLTVTFANGSTMVFSRQPPARQLWLASRSGGYHFEYDVDAGDWRDTRSGALFRPFVVAEMLSQGGVTLQI